MSLASILIPAAMAGALATLFPGEAAAVSGAGWNDRPYAGGAVEPIRSWRRSWGWYGRPYARYRYRAYPPRYYAYPGYAYPRYYYPYPYGYRPGISLHFSF